LSMATHEFCRLTTSVRRLVEYAFMRWLVARHAARLIDGGWWVWTKHQHHESRPYRARGTEVRPQVTSRASPRAALSGTVVAMSVTRQPQLFRFDQQASPEFATTDLPFVSVGSAITTADPFLAFIRRLFWPAGLPTLADGIFGALWTLQHAIQTSPGGVAEPVQVVLLQGSVARELDDVELQEQRRAIEAAEQRCANVRASFSADAATSPPPKPPE